MASTNGNLDYSPSTTTASSRKKGALNSKIDAPGKVTKTLGTGENAKNSIVYLVIRMAFAAGTIMSIFLIVYCCIFHNEINANNLMER